MSHLSLLVTSGRARPKPHVAVGSGGEPGTVWDARQGKSLTSASATQRRSTPQTFWFAGTSIVRPSMTTRTLLQPTKPPLAGAAGGAPAKCVVGPPRTGTSPLAGIEPPPLSSVRRTVPA